MFVKKKLSKKKMIHRRKECKTMKTRVFSSDYMKAEL